MKYIYLLIIFLSATTVYAQKCGDYKINIQGASNSNSPKFNMWTVENGFDFANYEFHETVQGLKDLEAKVEEIFKSNGYTKVPQGKNEGLTDPYLLDPYDKS